MRVLLPFVMAATVACTGDDKGDESATTDTGGDTAVCGNGTIEGTEECDDGNTDNGDGCSSECTTEVQYNLTVQLLEALPTPPATSPGPVPEGLCATLIDPTPVISGDAAIDLATGMTGKTGAVTFTKITAKPTLGLLVQIDDCKGAKEDYVGIATNTGVLPATYADAKDGETVSTTGFAIKGSTLAGMDASASALGYKTLEKGGFLFGYTFDSTLAPVAGVTVATDSGTPTYFYLDTNADPKDPLSGGLFAEVGGSPPAPIVNTETTAAGVFVIADAPIGQYTATDTSGTLTFDTTLIGGFPGQAVVIAFIGHDSSM